jgi:hypothetical protein
MQHATCDMQHATIGGRGRSHPLLTDLQSTATVRTRCHICTGTGPAPATSAPGLGPTLPHLHRDWARPCHICTGTGPAPATSAAGLGSLLPHLHQHWARPCQICTRSSLGAARSALDGRAHPCRICARTCAPPPRIRWSCPSSARAAPLRASSALQRQVHFVDADEMRTKNWLELAREQCVRLAASVRQRPRGTGFAMPRNAQRQRLAAHNWAAADQSRAIRRAAKG